MNSRESVIPLGNNDYLGRTRDCLYFVVADGLGGSYATFI
jgi:hypothetical protein